MYTVVTGAAGFIGANLVKALNERGVTRIIAVDNLTKADKFKNLKLRQAVPSKRSIASTGAPPAPVPASA